ncbi:MAG: DUF1573 domain-containing protein [Planctomycetota bacterium]|jgi:hypothetical protein
MTANRLISAVFIACCALLLHTGCEEETATPQRLDPRWFQQFEVPAQQSPAQPAVASNSNRPSPRITFEKVVHDFGNVGPLTDSLCEFGFTNTGDGTLRIGQVEKTCGCTPFSLDKTDYAPGESGSLKVKYYSDTQLGSTTKNLTIRSNDPVNPQVSLAIKARVISKVDYEPKSLSLLLKQENAGCPKITLTSTDGQPFSISHFRSTADFITADYNPSVKAMSFVLEPKIDMARLEKTLNGSIEIGLTHPQCKSIRVSVKTLPKFRITPIVARGTDPKEPILKKVRIVSNYGENFAIQSASSQRGTVRIVDSQPVNKGYELEVEIRPPAGNRVRVLTDKLLVRTTGGEQLEIPCNAYFAGAAPPPKWAGTSSKKSEKCKICGPRVITSSGVNARDF